MQALGVSQIAFVCSTLLKVECQKFIARVTGLFIINGVIDENESLIYITFDYEGTYIVHDTRAAYEIGLQTRI